MPFDLVNFTGIVGLQYYYSIIMMSKRQVHVVTAWLLYPSVLHLRTRSTPLVQSALEATCAAHLMLPQRELSAMLALLR